MKTLVWVDRLGDAVADGTLSAVTAASQLGSVNLLVAGHGVAAVAEAAAGVAGIDLVFMADEPAFAHALAENVAPLVVSLMGDHDAVLFAANTTGKNIAPRVAAMLDVMQIGDIVSVEGPDTFARPIYAGNAIATVRTRDTKRVITVRETAFGKAAASGGAGRLTAVESTGDAGLSTFLAAELAESERPELASAKVVVSGGRALGSRESFRDLVEPLADKLGAAIGATRAAVDAGYAPNSCQVGQTGKVVAPDLYLAIGVSGAVQHVAGMKESGTIVAINKDPDAPIFEVADIGLVADLFEAVPELIKNL